MISGILHLNSKTKYGMTSRNVPIYLFRPFDPKQSIFIVGCSHKNTATNLLVLIEPYDMGSRIPRGNLLHILGQCGDWEAERMAIRWTYSPHKQPDLPYDLVHPEPDGRLDLCGHMTINVDPLGCMDVDDCITFCEDKFVITIADVGAWVAKNPCLEAFAVNGQTLYNNGKAILPMFPPELSEDLFSLRVGQRRFGVSLVYPASGEPYWTRSMVRVTEAYEYDEVKTMHQLKEAAEHAIGHPVSNDPHDWIEALMVSYNSFMARELSKYSRGLFRGHEEPDAALMERYTAVCPAAAHLANQAATYQTFNKRTPHWGLAVDQYTHMTSPIRRWADVHNQMVLLGCEPVEQIIHLNHASKAAKKYERDIFFLRQLQISKKVSGIVIDLKTKVWVADWKRTITLYNVMFPIGTPLVIDFYLDMNQPTWKKRMVIAASKDCRESQSPEPVAP